MAASKALRLAQPGEARTGPVKPKSVTQAASEGSRLELLVAMRARVATAVEAAETPARDLAALTRRLLEIAKDIEVLKAAAAEEGHGDGAVGDSTFDASAI